MHKQYNKISVLKKKCSTSKYFFFRTISPIYYISLHQVRNISKECYINSITDETVRIITIYYVVTLVDILQVFPMHQVNVLRRMLEISLTLLYVHTVQAVKAHSSQAAKMCMCLFCSHMAYSTPELCKTVSIILTTIMFILKIHSNEL